MIGSNLDFITFDNSLINIFMNEEQKVEESKLLETQDKTSSLFLYANLNCSESILSTLPVEVAVIILKEKTLLHTLETFKRNVAFLHEKVKEMEASTLAMKTMMNRNDLA